MNKSVNRLGKFKVIVIKSLLNSLHILVYYREFLSSMNKKAIVIFANILRCTLYRLMNIPE